MSEPWQDSRLDPRCKARLKSMSEMSEMGSLSLDMKDIPDAQYPTWEELVAKNNTPEYKKRLQMIEQLMSGDGSTKVAPLDGLDIVDGTFESENITIPYVYMRPTKFANQNLPCVYYLHGGGMAAMSMRYTFYQVWLRTIAHQGVAVFAIDFRNSITPSTSKVVAPYPAGLNDCVNGLLYLHKNKTKFYIHNIIISGESGGGNLTIATTMRLKKMNQLDKISAFYPLCPYILGNYPDTKFPSTIENQKILLHLNHGAKHNYGVEAYNNKDPMAWPSFATVEDLRGLPPCMVSVNECDPLRDEGIAFYRKLVLAGVQAQARIVVGTPHGGELLGNCPDIAIETARSISQWAWHGNGIESAKL